MIFLKYKTFFLNKSKNRAICDRLLKRFHWIYYPSNFRKFLIRTNHRHHHTWMIIIESGQTLHFSAFISFHWIWFNLFVSPPFFYFTFFFVFNPLRSALFLFIWACLCVVLCPAIIIAQVFIIIALAIATGECCASGRRCRGWWVLLGGGGLQFPRNLWAMWHMVKTLFLCREKSSFSRSDLWSIACFVPGYFRLSMYHVFNIESILTRMIMLQYLILLIEYLQYPTNDG